MVALASETFNYTPIDKAKAKSVKFATERFPDTLGKNMKAGLPPKVSGSSTSDRNFWIIPGIILNRVFLVVIIVSFLRGIEN